MKKFFGNIVCAILDKGMMLTEYGNAEDPVSREIIRGTGLGLLPVMHCSSETTL